MTPSVLFLLGLIVIITGAELLLRGASRLAVMMGIKPIIIGLTIVAIGTSAPELAVGITAASEGKGALAVGNIAGTNMVNILLILGLSAALRPLPLQLMSIRLDVPVMIASALALFVMAWDGVLSQLEGLVLFSGAIAYTLAIIRLSRRESPEVHQEYAGAFPVKNNSRMHRVKRISLHSVLLVTGIIMTIWGADLLVTGASDMARRFGISDAVIGLTIVAVGTSMPELATTIVATIRNDRDVAVGNLIGSSTSNILVILGITCILSPQGIDISQDVLWIDLPLAAGVAIACYPVFRSGQIVSRAEGIAYVTAYLIYMATLLLLRI